MCLKMNWISVLFCSLLGGLVFECLAALKVDRLKTDCPNMKRILELKEEEEQQEKEDEDSHYNDNNGEVFSLELEKGERGLGLALVDTRVSEGYVNEWITMKCTFLTDKATDTQNSRGNDCTQAKRKETQVIVNKPNTSKMSTKCPSKTKNSLSESSKSWHFLIQSKQLSSCLICSLCYH